MTGKSRKGSVVVQEFRGVLRLVWSHGGKRHYLYCGLADTPLNRIVAEGKAKTIEGDLVTGNFDPTLAKYKPERYDTSATELFQKFMDSKKVDPRTLEKYRGLLKHIRRYYGDIKGAATINESSALKFSEYLSKFLAASTLNERLGLLESCWAWGIKQKIVNANPWKYRVSAPPKRKPNPFSKEEISKIISGFKLYYPHYLDFVQFLFGTGCRTGEAIGLKWQHINDDCSQVWIGETFSRGKRKTTKTRRDRTINLSAHLQEMLLSRRPTNFQGEDLVFPAPQGGTIDDHNFRNRAWKSVLNKLGIPYRKPYNSRHTLISHALDMGMNPVAVAELTGHNVRTLYEHYAGTINKVKLPDILSGDV